MFKTKLRRLFVLYWYLWTVASILILSAALRLCQLGAVPQSLSWDEVAIGYNGFAISQTGRDEWLKILPISFKSFGDYKAPLAIYLNGVFTLVFGLEDWAVRLPAALSGIMGVLLIVFVTRELLEFFYRPKSKAEVLNIKLMSLGCGFLLATTPWHIHFSRIAFESAIALTILLAGVWCFLRFIRYGQLWSLLASAGLLAATFYTYHTPKIMVPLLLITLGGFFFKQLWAKKTSVVLAIILGGLLLLPLAYDTFWGLGSQRLGQVTVKAGSTSEVIHIISQHFVAHFSLSYLIEGKTDTLRHGDGQWGVLLLPTYGLILFGLVSVFFTKQQGQRKFFALALFWISIGIFPASLGIDAPHANRSLLALPGFLWISIIGGQWLTNLLSQTNRAKNILGTHGETRLLTKSLLGTFMLVQSFFLIAYQHHYYTQFAFQTDDDFQAGYKELFHTLQKYETDPSVRQIIVSNRYGSSYIYALYTKKMNPFVYNYGGLNQYLLVNKVDAITLIEPNLVMVATRDDEMPFEKADQVIYDQQGRLRFAIFVTPK